MLCKQIKLQMIVSIQKNKNNWDLNTKNLDIFFFYKNIIVYNNYVKCKKESTKKNERRITNKSF